MGDDELVVLVLSGWSDGPLPALEHSLRQRGLRCVRVPHSFHMRYATLDTLHCAVTSAHMSPTYRDFRD